MRLLRASREAVEHTRILYGPDHPTYASALSELACLFCMVKQFEEAIPRYEEVLAIRQMVYGDQHLFTVGTAQLLAAARQDAKKSHRDKIDVGHEFRMCSQCGNIQENMNVCPCFRAWYCGADCQQQHWATHKPHCNVCLHCNTLLTKILRCSRCNKAILQCSVPKGPLEPSTRWSAWRQRTSNGEEGLCRVGRGSMWEAPRGGALL
jgi:hypothetical protein